MTFKTTLELDVTELRMINGGYVAVENENDCDCSSKQNPGKPCAPALV